jgi:hypothetical protein
MSAFLFHDEAIHRLVVALQVEQFFAGRDRSTLGASLLAMNEAAVNARYNETSKRNEPYVWQTPPVFNALQAYKTVRSFLYQCSEGDVPETWPLYAQVTQVREFYSQLLGHDYAANRWSSAKRAAEYNEAEWG